jgi:hypothetical protein
MVLEIIKSLKSLNRQVSFASDPLFQFPFPLFNSLPALSFCFLSRPRFDISFAEIVPLLAS